MKVMLIEDDPAMQTTLQRALRASGMQVVGCTDGERALDRWRASVPDVVVLDLSLPGRDGLRVLGDARAEGLRTPVLILTARGTVGDRVLGLNTGADDYLPKPFDLDELEARLRALARRGEASSSLPHAAAEFCGLRVDAEQGAIYRGTQIMDLAPREAALLRALLKRPGQAMAKERLCELVFAGESAVATEAIEVVAYRLRKKLAGTGVELVTLRGLGYLLQAQS
jgi:two-component system, OmpR family, response regulator TctD